MRDDKRADGSRNGNGYREKREALQSELLADAWGYAYIGASRTVDVHINRLRRKLGLAREIQTVFKVGYRLSAAG